MIRIASRLLPFLLVLAGCSGAFPDEELRNPPHPEAVSQRPEAIERFVALDIKGRGGIDREVAEGHWTEIFGIIDAHGDGHLTAAEFMALPSPRMTARDQLMIMNDPQRYRSFLRLDRGSKGYVTLDDFLAERGALFDMLDRNHDGVLSPDELGIPLQVQPADLGIVRFPPQPPAQLPPTPVPAAPSAAAAAAAIKPLATPPVGTPASVATPPALAAHPSVPAVQPPAPIDSAPPPKPRMLPTTNDNGPPPAPPAIAPTIDNGPPPAPPEH